MFPTCFEEIICLFQPDDSFLFMRKKGRVFPPYDNLYMGEGRKKDGPASFAAFFANVKRRKEGEINFLSSSSSFPRQKGKGKKV